jgi:hypothetical protein
MNFALAFLPAPSTLCLQTAPLRVCRQSGIRTLRYSFSFNNFLRVRSSYKRCHSEAHSGWGMSLGQCSLPDGQAQPVTPPLTARSYLQADLDHIALQTREDPLELASRYADVLRFAPIDFDSFRAGKRPFPSVRISDTCILDFFGPKDSNPTAAGPSNGNHICFALRSKDHLDVVIKALCTAGHPPEQETPVRRSGARGEGHSVYAKDPEGNALEFRAYY